MLPFYFLKQEGMKLLAEGFEACFEELEDPRIDRKKLYPLHEILFVALCGALSGADSWRELVTFARTKLPWFKEHFEFANGIASKNTFCRVFAALDPGVFQGCFIQWAQGLEGALSGVVAIDGKTLKGSFDAGLGQSAIHMVSAFAAGSKLVLGQEKVNEKSNEITAIPALLDVLDIKGQTVTIDAMGCQKEIAQKIVDKGADYVLALKGNQGTLNTDVRALLETAVLDASSEVITDECEDVDAGHGRIEKRQCFVSDQLEGLQQKPQWAKLKTVAMIEETRECAGKVSVERRFFISSLSADAKEVAQAVRAHWSIENNLHWTLDVVFNEDRSRVRKQNAPQNMAIVRHFAMNMLNHAKATMKGIGLKGLRKKAGWCNATLSSILRRNF
jgi:predicted transposase YbfD/YdcC